MKIIKYIIFIYITFVTNDRRILYSNSDYYRRYITVSHVFEKKKTKLNQKFNHTVVLKQISICVKDRRNKNET